LIIYLNGEFVLRGEAKISVFDQGVLMGDGVFEGIRTYKGRIFKCTEHIDRLYYAAKAIMIDIPLRKNELIEYIQETCKRNNIQDGYIRLVVTRGIGDLSLLSPNGSEPTVFCIASKISLYPRELYEKGLLYGEPGAPAHDEFDIPLERPRKPGVNVNVNVGDSKELSAAFERVWHEATYALRKVEAENMYRAYNLQQVGTYV